MPSTLETFSGDEVGTGQAPLAPGLPDPPAEHGRDGAKATSRHVGRVLLLEDDESLRGIIDDCLSGNGYTVVAVPSGGEGVREVLAGDFTMVLCDFMMPGLPGDMFYRAVERIRPDLCQRFIFMTGHQGDDETNEFIKKVNGFVLRKPFSIAALLDSLALAEVRRSYQSICGEIPVGTESKGTSPSVPAALLEGSFFPESSTLDERAARILARVRAQSPPDRPAREMHVVEPDLRAGGGTLSFIFSGLALLVLLAGGLSKRYFDVRNRVEVALAERLALDAEWTAISPRLEQAAAVRKKIETAQIQLAGVSADRSKPRWAPAFRSIMACADLGIQVREVRGGEKSGDEKAWTLLVGGVASGPVPRKVADRFRRKLEHELGNIFQGGVTVRLERFEDLPDMPSASQDDHRGTFAVVATMSLDEKDGTSGKEGA